MSRPLVGHADMLRILSLAGEAPRTLIAEFLDWETTQRIPKTDRRPPFTKGGMDETPNPPPGTSEKETVHNLAPATHWVATRFSLRDVRPTAELIAADPGRILWQDQPAQAPPRIPLCPWPALIPRLRDQLSLRSSGRHVDWDRFVNQTARGLPIRRLPRLRQRRWGECVHIVVDRSDRLIPYWSDQQDVVSEFRRILQKSGLHLFVGTDPGSAELKDVDHFEDASLVLVLGDLGSLELRNRSLAESWYQWGLRLRGQGAGLMALVPCATERIPAEHRQVFSIVSWQHRPQANVVSAESRQAAVEQMLCWLAPAIRIEPDLLRRIRAMLKTPSEAAHDASLEAEFWQHPTVCNPHPDAAELDVATVNATLLPQFESQPPEDRLAVLTCLRQCRPKSLPPEIWLQEFARLSPGTRALLSQTRDWDDAKAMLRNLASRVDAHDDDAPAVRAFSRRLLPKLPNEDADEKEVGAVKRFLDRACHSHGTNRISGWDPAEESRGSSVESIDVRLCGDELTFPNSHSKYHNATEGSHLASLRSTNGGIRISSFDPFWHAGHPPAWASSWGQDQYGRYAEFTVGGVTQRMRWIEPGRFLMGSPEDEEGRYDDEGPQHSVTITKGYWLFDTPCTQDLWEAVLGKEASKCEFKGPRRPVESVDWNDAVAFTEKLNVLLPGLGLRLPQEAEWEYACRAGTTTPRYGDMDDVAWHSGNSGKATHDVGQKMANAWGLFDTLGNVQEWCADDMRKYKSESMTDPDGGSGAERVIRGGSWALSARSVRAASRFWAHPGLRLADLGFRPLSSGDQPSKASRRPRSGVWRAEPVLGAERPAPEAQKISIFVRDRVSVAVPKGKAFQLDSDSERLVFESITKPDWADEIGRDRFGLWTTLQVKDAVQKLRWIPPGRFLMGSPESEEGRATWEGPQHSVVISKGYWLFDTPCCQDLYEAVLDKDANDSRFRGPRRPVERVDWNHTVAFTRRLKELKPGLYLRLPSEAEWEYACRAGSTAARYGELDKIAWYQEHREREETHDVARLQPNAWGLFDMLGNVWEWCRDTWSDNYSPDLAIDPVNKGGAERVIRGGSWAFTARLVRAAYRDWYPPGYRRDYLGFRPLSSGIREEEEEPVREAAGAAERSKAASGASAKISDFAGVLSDEAEPKAGPPPKQPKKPRK